MQWINLPVKGGSYKNIAEDALNAVGSSLLDGYLDEFGNVVGRPGLVEFCDLGTGEPVDGLYWWPVQKVCIAVSGRRVFKITDNNGTYTEITGYPYAHDTIQKLVRVTWADFGDRLYFANGGEISVIRGADITGLAITLGTDTAPTAMGSDLKMVQNANEFHKDSLIITRKVDASSQIRIRGSGTTPQYELRTIGYKYLWD
jgi:hypothetical protein